eukprot:scaffold4.g5033.t1
MAGGFSPFWSPAKARPAEAAAPLDPLTLEDLDSALEEDTGPARRTRPHDGNADDLVPAGSSPEGSARGNTLLGRLRSAGALLPSPSSASVAAADAGWWTLDAVAERLPSGLGTSLSSLSSLSLRRRGAAPPPVRVPVRRLRRRGRGDARGRQEEEQEEAAVLATAQTTVDALLEQCAAAAGVPASALQLRVEEERPSCAGGSAGDLLGLLRTAASAGGAARARRWLQGWAAYLLVPEGLSREMRGRGLVRWLRTHVWRRLQEPAPGPPPGTAAIEVQVAAPEQPSLALVVPLAMNIHQARRATAACAADRAAAQLRRQSFRPVRSCNCAPCGPPPACPPPSAQLRLLVQQRADIPPPRQVLAAAEVAPPSRWAELAWAAARLALRLLLGCLRLWGRALGLVAPPPAQVRCAVILASGREVTMQARPAAGGRRGRAAAALRGAPRCPPPSRRRPAHHARRMRMQVEAQHGETLDLRRAIQLSPSKRRP